MSDATLIEWRAEELPSEQRQEHFKAAKSYAAEIRSIGRSHRWLGFIVGACGTVIGLGGLTAAALVMVANRTPPPPRWIAVDQSTGWTGEPISAKDALRVINDHARQSYVRTLIEKCEGFNPVTLDLDDHTCELMLSPEQQKLYKARTDKKNPDAPINTLGAKGAARVEAKMLWWPLTPAKPGTYGYRVDFSRTELSPSGHPVRKNWRAEVYFSLNPSARMSPEDLTDNPAGFQAFNYTVQPWGTE